MARSTRVIVVLVALLVVTNGWWAYKVLDSGITYTYIRASLESNEEALAQSLAVIEAATQVDATRQSIVQAARTAGRNSEPFEKDGYVWVGSIGLRFDSTGHLVKVSRAWSPP